METINGGAVYTSSGAVYTNGAVVYTSGTVVYSRHIWQMIFIPDRKRLVAYKRRDIL